MKTAIIAGSGGLTGSALLGLLANHKEFSTVWVLKRAFSEGLSTEIGQIITDFRSFSLPPGISPANTVVFCCTGTTIRKAGSKEAFDEVDRLIPLRLAEWCKKEGFPTLFVVSSVGANPDSSNFYLRTKGVMQEQIMKLGLNSVYFLQPSLLTGNRREFRFFEKIGRLLAPLFDLFFVGPLTKYKSVPAAKLAQAMFTLAQSPAPGTHFLDSSALLKLANT